MGQLRLFALDRGINWSMYDGYSSRLRYDRVSDTKYYIGSVAYPKIQERKGHQYHNLKEIYAGLESNGQQAFTPFVSLAILQEGYKITEKKVARVESSRQEHKRTLVVSGRSKYSLQIAPHGHVEEFVWISRNRIIYTATNDEKAPDGVYLWDLETDTTTNLLSRLTNDFKINSGRVDPRYYMSLLGKSQKQLYIVITLNDGRGLNPADFYTPRNLYQVSLKNPRNLIKTEGTNVPKLSFGPTALESITSKLNPRSPQKAWLELPLNGNPQKILEAWQNYSLKFSSSSTYPYALYWLACIYKEAYVSLSDPNQHENNGLKALETFGLEINNSLINTKSTPNYLKAFGLDQKERFLTNRSLGFKVSHL